MNTCAQCNAADDAQYPKFTQDMKTTHKLLIPQMAPIHFCLIADAIRQGGYDIELLENTGPEVVRQGLQYVHNDACYPALLVIGQFIDALNSGKYDLDKTALMITQTGGGCRASNYIHMLRKALQKAGYGNIPVASLNLSGLEKDSGFSMTLSTIRKAIAACLYGDELMALNNQTKPYEHNVGESEALVKTWQDRICAQFARGRGVSKRDMKRIFNEIARDFARIPITRVPKVKVGIVGEIYVKYSPLGNNHLEEFLAREGCEISMPGLLGFVQYCIESIIENTNLYGGSRIAQRMMKEALAFTTRREQLMVAAIARYRGLTPPSLFEHVKTLANGFISLGAKMGEGWLLTAEMVELVQSGFSNIICAQPFGCLPNHVVGKGMISKLRAVYPQANITPIDYDPGATKVNQENRIKLMLASALEINKRLDSAIAAARHGFKNDFMERLNQEFKDLKKKKSVFIRLMM